MIYSSQLSSNYICHHPIVYFVLSYQLICMLFSLSLSANSTCIHFNSLLAISFHDYCDVPRDFPIRKWRIISSYSLWTLKLRMFYVFGTHMSSYRTKYKLRRAYGVRSFVVIYNNSYTNFQLQAPGAKIDLLGAAYCQWSPGPVMINSVPGCQ